MTLGFVVDKFYPPHRGHKLLIDTARRQVDRLVVLLPHHPSQKIPGGGAPSVARGDPPRL